jgi:hypothetical protein
MTRILQVAHTEGDTRTVLLEGYEGEEQCGAAGPTEMPVLDSTVSFLDCIPVYTRVDICDIGAAS